MANVLDRNYTPAFKTVEEVEMIRAKASKLANNIPVYSINAGTQDIIKVEFIFRAGIYFQDKPLQASTTSAMIEEGTSNMTASEIADAVDFYGAFLETGVAQDSASVSLYTLTKHLASVLPIIEEVIKSATFPEKELGIHLQNKLQKFRVNNQKVSTIARKRFTELLFGEKHPYGINVKEEDFASLKKEDLVLFHKQYYNSNNCNIILAGKIDESVILLLDKHFGGSDWSGNNNLLVKNDSVSIIKEREQLVSKDDAIQSAIRIGKTLFNKKHKDFQALLVLNTVFGGYFGSRLMSNIREDKGYTYGIGSGIVSLKNSGYFFISTEVGVDVCGKAIHEIYKEMDRLKEELIKDQELQLVKNYMIGTFLRSVDGPFAMADRFKGLLEYELDYDYYDAYLATIKTVSASKLRELANEYLDKNSMLELVVGKK